jgi:hypothetical protein
VRPTFSFLMMSDQNKDKIVRGETEIKQEGD